jgi:hypothetical protein
MDPQAALVGPYFQILFLLVFLVVFILFYLTQYRLLKLIRLEHREMNPGQVWWQIIPIIGLIWTFITVRKIAVSISNELNSPVDDSVLGTAPNVGRYPTYTIGLTYCILFCLTIIPFPDLIKGLCSLAGITTWIIYWVMLGSYKNKLKRYAELRPQELFS